MGDGDLGGGGNALQFGRQSGSGWGASQQQCCIMSGECPGFPREVAHPCEGDRQLVAVTRGLLQNSLAPASRHAYSSGQRRFTDFCRRYGLTAVPASEATLTFFIGHLHREGLSVSTARQYLAAVRRLHLQWGWPLPIEPSPYVAAALQGFEPRGALPNECRRQALTVQHLRDLKTRLALLLPSVWDQRCTWAACTLGFYGGLRSNEYLFTGSGRGARRSNLHFTAEGCRLRVDIQKNRQHGPPTYIDLPTVGTSTCPVRALRYFCQARDVTQPASAPLFLLETGVPLTRRRLNRILRHALGTGFSSHSLRIGLVTTAAAAGVEDNVLQRLGRWRSSAYDGYVRGQRRIVANALMAVARS